MSKIKCVVWDLDNTLWHGRLAEQDKLILKEDIVGIIKVFDSRGILQSVASRNNFDEAIKQLDAFHLTKYFLYPQIHWNQKSHSIKTIAESLNIGLDTFAFIDDEPFERAEVVAHLPDVYCLSETDILEDYLSERFVPRFITEDSKNRRQLYQTDIIRNTLESTYEGPQEEFLATLSMKLSIYSATIEDLQRAEELTIRTHQLNTTGLTYSYDELLKLTLSEDYDLLILELEDKFGDYGKIGLVLLHRPDAENWRIKLLLLSCRVMTRGIGSILITYLRQEARSASVRLYADFQPTDRNRMMYLTYKMNGFREVDDSETNLVNYLDDIPQMPRYIELHTDNIFTEQIYGR